MKVNGSWDSVLREERLEMNDYIRAIAVKVSDGSTVVDLYPVPKDLTSVRLRPSQDRRERRERRERQLWVIVVN